MSIAQNQVLTSRFLFEHPIVPFIRIGEIAIRTHWTIPERRLLDYLLLYVQEGECRISVNEISYHLQASEFCLIQPNDLFSLEGLTKTVIPFVHLDIFYNSERENSFPTRPGQIDISAFSHLLQPRLNDYQGIHIPVKLPVPNPDSFSAKLLTMITQWQQPDALHQLEAQHTATGLILDVLKEQGALNTERYEEPQSLSWIPSYLSLHLAESISIADMAEHAHLSASRFSALFRQLFGIPPHQYLLRLRIQHAQNLLVNSALSLRLIAQYCGFADVQHFTKAFKKVTHRTPKSLRKMSTEAQTEDVL